MGLVVRVGIALETIPKAAVCFSLLNASFIEPSSLSFYPVIIIIGPVSM